MGSNVKMRLFGAGLAVCASLANQANATITIPFNPDGATLTHTVSIGPGGSLIHTPIKELQSLDWNFGNALAVGYGSGVPGTVFTTYYQAKLATFTDEDLLNQTLFSDGTAAGVKQLDSSFEWTVVAKFKEIVISNDGTTARFVPLADASNYLKIFYDTTPDANDLTGMGFADGLEIFRAADPVVGLGVFTSAGNTVLLDQVNDDDLGGQMTLDGAGGFNVTADIAYLDTNFLNMPNPGLNQFRITFFNSSNILPFLQVDPALAFFDMDLNAGLGGTFAPNLGAINGHPVLGGPDVQFQVDANQSFDIIDRAIPEPATAAMGLLGLIGLSVAGVRRRRHA